MKKIYLFILIALFTISLKAASYTVSIVGTSYSPATLTVNVGDVVTIQGSMAHPLAQVDQTTWNANGTATLSGGWGVSTSNVTFTVANTNTIYYVCTAHVSFGMKGQVIVNSTAGLNQISFNSLPLALYPNPASEVVNMNYSLNEDAQVRIELLSITGNLAAVLADEKCSNGANSQRLEIPSEIKSGLYFINVRTNGNVVSQRSLIIK